MTEFNTDNEKALFAELDTYRIDPVMKRVFGLIDTLHDELKEIQDGGEDPGTYDFKPTMQVLHTIWPYLGHELNVSGEAITADSTQSSEGEVVIIQGQDLISRGFILSKNHETNRPEVLLWLMDPSNEDRLIMARHEAVHIDYPFHSAEHADNVLHADYPELMEEIDEILTGSKDEVEALMRLRQITVTRQNDNISAEFSQHLTRYISANLKFDDEAGYIAEFIDGGIMLDTPDDEAPPIALFEDDFHQIVKIDQVLYAPHYNELIEDGEHESFELVPQVRCRILGDNTDTHSGMFIVALEDIHSLTSVRQLVRDRKLGEGALRLFNPEKH